MLTQFFLTGTFVPLSLSEAYTSPVDFLKYQWYRIFSWGIEKLSVVKFKLESMPNWTTRPRWKASRGKIAPTAKAMYADMLNAFAAGDKKAIHQLCLGNFAKKLTAAIDRRPADVVTKFEITSFNKPLLFPAWWPTRCTT